MDDKLAKKLRILADAAKYDASCASSGAPKRKADADGLGSTTGAGICHAYTPDGRCVSLLKILLTNYCLFDCAYCVNRRSSNVARARFTVDEVVDLTLAFYKRNYIEGLFLSSGIIRSPDHTMEQMLLVAKTLRREHGFRGYIHLKTIPEASPWLIEQAGLWADRLSINLELPSRGEPASAWRRRRTARSIERAMAQMRERIDEARGGAAALLAGRAVDPDDRRRRCDHGRGRAAHERDALRRLRSQARLLLGLQPDPGFERASCPLKPPPLQRENRLYQADWLLRYYGFDVEEIAAAARTACSTSRSTRSSPGR